MASSSKVRALGLTLFGAVFLAVGLTAGFLTARQLKQSETAQREWIETPARILECDLRVSNNSDGGPTYKATATYAYEFNGARYASSRVSFQTASDNIGDFQRQTHQKLKALQASGETIVCWVNPARPSESVLLPRPRPEMLAFMQVFTFAFGGFGLAIVLLGLSGCFAPPVCPRAGPNAALGMGRIRMSGADAHRIAGCVALVWNGYAIWLMWRVGQALAPERLPWYLGLVGASGIVAAGVAACQFLKIHAFGISVLELSPWPGVLGGPVNGTIRIPKRVEAHGEGFTLTLRCVHQSTTKRGKNSTTHRDTLWEESRHIGPGHCDGSETLLPVRFTAPYDKPATTAPLGQNGHFWTLTAELKRPGLDYCATFAVPVQRTAQSSPDRLMSPAASSPENLEPIGQVMARERLNLQPRGDGGFELVFPACRPRSMIVGLAVFLLLWSGVCALLWFADRAPVLLAAVFTLFAMLMAALLLDLLLMTRGVTVDRQAGRFDFWSRLGGARQRHRTLAFNEILDIQSERSGQSGNTTYYRLTASATKGPPVTIASHLRMWRNAEAIARLLQAAMAPTFKLPSFRV